VRILTGLTTLGAAALALPSLAGCSTDVQDDDVGTGTENNTESIAGSGVLSIHGWRVNYGSTSNGDEFIRVGEKMKVSMDFIATTRLAAGADQALQQELQSDPNKLTVTLRAQYTKSDGSTFESPPIKVTWGPGASNLTAGTSDEFVIPKGVRLLKIETLASFSQGGAPQTVPLLERAGIAREMVVFGAFHPNKLALFDTMGAERRTRLLEGGAVLKSSTLLLSVTDWRLDTVVERNALDLRIGDQRTANRFGPAIVPAFGELEYEVSAVVSTDGGATFQPLGLTKNSNPDVLAKGGFRHTYETQAAIPGNAGSKLKVAFHVRAFVKVPNDGSILNGRYAPGSRVLVKDVWDNNGGDDYALPILAQ
jgi:hypothetical protein